MAISTLRDVFSLFNSRIGQYKLDPDDIEAQGEPEGDPMGDDLLGDDSMGDEMGDPEMAPEPEPEVSAAPEEPVDSAMMGLLQGHDYMQRYDHSDLTAASHPVSIMGMEMSDLSGLRNRLRVYLDQVGVSDRIGKYDDPSIKAAQDQLAFVDKVMGFKKHEAKDQNTSTGKPPKVRARKESAVQAGQKFKAKRS